MTEDESTKAPEQDLLKILVASDIHLGYNEKDSLRGNDSFIAFEEILQNAVSSKVDMILLGGDLFHDAKPTPNSLQRCMKLLRQYTLGDTPIALEFLSDQALNFQEALNQTVNYEDPNMNIAYPVFSIHGNHDDPSGFGRLSTLDLLATNGLVNYFGKWTDLTKINISPILLKKGCTQLALYGLSYIHDNRLARLFRDSKVILEKPDPETGKWFNIFVLHQNRADRGIKNYIPEAILPNFLDLVVWGHEHDCRIVPEVSANGKFYVTQPGSSVATSLSEGESLDKHVGLLLVYKDEFKLEPIKLNSVRPFVFDSINLIDYVEELGLDEGDTNAKVQAFVTRRIDKMIQKAQEKISDNPNQPKEPLIRLRILYNDEDHMFNSIRFGQQYKDLVANPIDMILFKKMVRRGKGEFKPFDASAMDEAFSKHVENDESKIEDIVDRYFNSADNVSQLEVLFPKSMNELCRRLVEYDDDDAAQNIVKFHHQKACEYLNEEMPAEEDVDEVLGRFSIKSDELFESVLKMLDSRGGKKSTATGVDIKQIDYDDDDNDVEFVPAANASSRGSKKQATTSRAATTANRATNGSANNSTTTTAASSTRATGPGSRGGRGGRGARGGGRATVVAPKELNVSVMSASPKNKAATVQPTIQSSFSSQSTRSSQRPAAKRPGRFTEYITDSDDD